MLYEVITRGADCYGKGGDDVELRMPVGTIISLQETGEVIADLDHDGKRVMIARGGRGGLGVFAGPTAGFILGWIPSALIVGLIFWALTSRARPGLGAGRVALGAAVAGLIGGIVMVYFFGVLGFVGIAGMEFGAAVLSMAPFVPGDLIKLVVAVILVVGLWKAYPRAFR